ncbi:molybdopterin-synthase adenylyltransferase MoeB [Aeromonas simiae]|uniref:molybdopterin-synthase adenylyltransferase MoeB n=1 Tax=Aeromonas simiae TaxID=218936 RepID=UPI0005A63DF1|nr:molybdopterin-synthase adenylyltransferase MoeB [Aeromonas simiae]MDO2948763.1 molybdopterin-synthase adenylyltransferase MoeB [Aeromonas simiae]MDO2956146.1 molybdopterin-synthase adenylyltransferase MoeB [Aeromonas simiae]
MSDILSDDELLRYNRQIILKSFDFEGQEALKQARVLVIGAGGLGCAAAQYLAVAGVGHLTLVDFDVVERSNLQRQVLHCDARLGQPKVISAATALRALNPYLTVEATQAQADAALLDALLPSHHLILDCSDNLTTRNLLNRRARAHRVPLVSGAAIRFEGQVCSFLWHEGEPCYECLSQLFGEQALTCVEAGVLAPVVGLVGSVQALEAIKILAGCGEPLTHRMLLIDGLSGQFRPLRLPRRADCPCCGEAP